MPDFFTGDQARKPEKTAIDLIKSQLLAALSNGALGDRYRKYGGGVEVISEDAMAMRTVEGYSSRPTVFLSMDEHKRLHHEREVDGVIRRGKRHDMTITAELITSDDCFEVEPDLRDDIQEIIESSKKPLRLAGFMDAKCDPNPARVSDPNKINPVAISGMMFTLRDPATP